MRILITIPHFYNPDGDRRYASSQPNPQPRIYAFTQCLRNLHMLYTGADEIWYREGDRLHAGPANQTSRVEIDVVVCTCRDLHLLDQISMPSGCYVHERFDCEPMELGFECHEVLQQRLGDYDLYGYMEDDLILHDPAFFTKLARFQEMTSDRVVLQPNRYERYISDQQMKKVYIDFEFAPEAAVDDRPAEPVIIQPYGDEIQLRRTSNAHAGCFFLSAAQMTYWADQDSFGNRDSSYVGPLESAATLGLIRNFQVLKPAPSSAHFLEIEHFGQVWSRKLAAVRFGSQSTAS